MKYRFWLTLFQLACKIEALAVHLRDFAQRKKMDLIYRELSQPW